MPTWDGDFTTKELYLERMDIYCKNKYFSSVTDWYTADLLHLDHSNHLRSELLRTIPKAKLPAYINQPALKDGFVFLKTWLADNSPSSAYHKLQCIMQFANFTAGETPGQTLLAQARGLLAALTSINNEVLMSMRVIVSFADICNSKNTYVSV
jgi:hypothetical protein